MRTILFFFLFLCITSGVLCQVTDAEKVVRKHSTDSLKGWKKGATIAFNITQVSLTNWAAGGQNSFSGNGLFNAHAHYKKGKSYWENYLELGYGILKQGKDEDWMKTDDKIDLSSKYGRKTGKHWYIAAFANFKTQMTAGYNYPDDSTKISDLFAPAYILGAIGMEYKPNDDFQVFMAPVTGKATLVNDQDLADAGAFGVEAAEYDSLGAVVAHGQKSRVELGGYFRCFYKKEIMENISLQTKLDLFSNYLKNPQNIDVNWEVLLSMKINKYISATISTHLIYDDDTKFEIDDNNDGTIDHRRPLTQFKEVLGIGFLYKF